MEKNKLTIKESSTTDLANIMELWNNGEVMHYVGFPNGLGVTLEQLTKWLPWAIHKPTRCHYSIYEDEIGYCGETFYDVDPEHGLSALDIKLLPIAQGRGIAKVAISYAINQAFKEGGAKRVYVDPHPDNKNAWKLYEKLGFKEKPRPTHLEPGTTYLEIEADDWKKENA